MNAQVQKFALSVAAVLSGVYLVCAAVVTLAPALATALFGTLSHLLNVEVLKFGLTRGALLGGLVQVALYSYALAWVVGALAVHFFQAAPRAAGR